MNTTSRILYKFWDEIYEYNTMYNNAGQNMFFNNLDIYRKYLLNRTVIFFDNEYYIEQISTVSGIMYFDITSDDSYRNDVLGVLLCLKPD